MKINPLDLWPFLVAVLGWLGVVGIRKNREAKRAQAAASRAQEQQKTAEQGLVKEKARGDVLVVWDELKERQDLSGAERIALLLAHARERRGQPDGSGH